MISCFKITGFWQKKYFFCQKSNTLGDATLRETATKKRAKRGIFWKNVPVSLKEKSVDL